MATSTEAPLDETAAAAVPAGAYPLSDRHGTVQVEAFTLDVHLVTVRRYRRFIDAGGYLDKQFWDPKGWRFMRKYELEVPRFWAEEKWQHFLAPNQPVVGVCWYEADAFARFEGRRLPSEHEWEAAARGTQGRLYPWGDQWNEAAAKVRGEGPRVTWPIGSFVEGVGPFGHYDLIGNVWQYTADAVDPSDSDSPMIAKGGSWASRRDQNQSDVWNAYDKGSQHSHVGFRTAR